MRAHHCEHPTDDEGPRWTGEVHHDGSPLWECPLCGRWWGFGWPGFGGHIESHTWLPMRSFFTGHRPSEFADLIEAHRDPAGQLPD